MDLLAFSTRDVYRLAALAARARGDGMTTLAELEAYLGQEVQRREAAMAPVAVKKVPSDEQVCPSCGRFVMTRPNGVAEPVLECRACGFSLYEECDNGL